MRRGTSPERAHAPVTSYNTATAAKAAIAPQWDQAMTRKILVLAPLALSVLGCVPQEKYDDLLTAYRAKEQQTLQAQNEVDRMRSKEAMLRGQMQDYVSKLEQAELQIGDQNSEISGLRTEFEGLQEMVGNLDFGPLPPELNEKLVRLASENSNLLAYDEQTGMLQFASDLTFALGSVELNPAAQEAIRALADIMDEGDGLAFEIRVVGHTDNVPLRSGSIYRSNVQLSAQRAISVRNALVRDGVAPARIMVGGYGEFRPIAENGKRGSAANRRVEIFLVPMPASMTPMGDDEITIDLESDAPAPAAPAPAEIEPLK